MIYIILGTKAQLIKMAPLMILMNERNIEYKFINTGQHKETFQEMLDDFGLRKPDIVLYDGSDIVKIGNMFNWALKILWRGFINRNSIFNTNSSDDIVLVHGDTLSTLLGAVIAKISGLSVGHVEAGLRSHNYFHPFPEELIRVCVTRISNILFCPGESAMSNVKHLRKDIVDTKHNTMADTLSLTMKKKLREDHVPKEKYCIVSVHRYENIFNKTRLDFVLESVKNISDKFLVLFILHPPTKKQLEKNRLLPSLEKNKNIELRDRYDHSDFLALLKNAEFVATDGGSLQEETSYLGVPCLLLRKVTERNEGIGSNVIVSGYDKSVINEFISNYSMLTVGKTKIDFTVSNLILDYLSLRP